MTKFPHAKLAALLALVMLCNAGCVTKGVWRTQDFTPGSEPKFSMSPEGSDVLVRYDECYFSYPVSNSKERTPRAYWLLASANRPQESAPDFVNAGESTNWISVPVARLILPPLVKVKDKCDR